MTVEIPNRVERRGAPFYFLFAAAGLFALVTRPLRPLSALGFIEVLLFVLLGLRALGSGISLDQNGLTSRAPGFTRRLRWDEVDRFASRWGRVGVWRTDGRWRTLQWYSPLYRSTIRSILNQLDAARRDHGEGQE